MPQLLKTGYAAPTYMMVMDPKLKVIQSWVNTEDNVPKNYGFLVKFTGKSVQNQINSSAVLPKSDDYFCPKNGKLLLRMNGVRFDESKNYTYYIVSG